MSSEQNPIEPNSSGITRRNMIVSTAAAITAIAIAKVTGLEAAPYVAPLENTPPVVSAGVSFMVNGKAHAL